jgi:hypothetical protein
MMKKKTEKINIFGGDGAAKAESGSCFSFGSLALC